MTEAMSRRAVNTSPRASILPKAADTSAIENHLRVSEGLETSVLQALLGAFTEIATSEVLKAIGVSSKTLDRKENARLNRSHSDAAFALIEIAGMAERVFGSPHLAQQWLVKPATGLNGQRPLDLLTTSPGIGAVKDLLGRIEYGVYA